MSRIIATFTVLVLLAVTAGPGRADSQILIRFSHVVSESTAKGIGARLFKQRAEERLAGKVKVEIYPRSQKFNDTEVVMALLFGDVEMAAPSFAKLAPYSSDFRIFDLPFLFPDVDSVHAFQHSPAGQGLMDAMVPLGIKGLAYWDNGMRVMSATRSLVQPSDVEGLSFRIEPSALFHEQYTLLGAIPRPMPFSRLNDAIRVGLIDGQENTWSNIHAQDVYRAHKHFLELDHSFLGYLVITSGEFWDGLPTDVRVDLTDILAEISVEVNKEAAEQALEYRRRVQEVEGIEIVRPASQEKQSWRDAMCGAWQPFTASIDEEVMGAALETAKLGMLTASGNAALPADTRSSLNRTVAFNAIAPCSDLD